MLSNFERYLLTFGPTPIERLSRLTAHLGGDVEIFAKREDCNSGLAFGGNKLRKLEYIVPDAIASNADTLVSIGGVQSNHTRMVAAVAAKIGMKALDRPHNVGEAEADPASADHAGTESLRTRRWREPDSNRRSQGSRLDAVRLSRARRKLRR